MEHREELVDVIRGIRNRWRLRLATRGVVVVFVGMVAVLLLSASSLEAFKFSVPAIIGFRFLAVAVFAALVAYALVPLRRQATDTQVALYLEEHNPSLEAAILSAVEASSTARASQSQRLVERLIEQAIAQSLAVEHGMAIDRPRLRRHAVTLATFAVGAALFVALGPAYVRSGLSALLKLSQSAEAASPYRIDVTPQNASVPRGGDQSVRAKLLGFTSKDVTLMMRSAGATEFERLPLIASADAETFEGMMFRLDKDTEYYVDSDGVQSKHFRLTVVDLPTVRQLDLEYRFPAYTNLPPRKEENGGDVAALRGTDVLLHITPTMKTSGGQILFKEGAAAPLAVQADGTLTGHFKLSQPGFYRIELVGPKGEQVNASPQYTIDVLDDQPPTVSFSKPGRDTSASPVQEVFTEAKADDDFGIKQLQMVYSVNGGPQKTIALFGGGKALARVSAGHTIYLEELSLQPGDFVSYFARATDNDAVPGPQTALSDIYFVQIRPFRKDYKQAQSQAQGGGGGDVGELSRQQRQIVAATFNTVRDKAKIKADKYRENVVFLNLAQAKLRAQVEELLAKLKDRLGALDHDSEFRSIAEQLPKAAAEMLQAESDLKAMKPDAALAPEQRALKILQVVEQQYEVQIASQNGGGGGQQSQMAEDLADLFELELDKLANQYEMKQQAEQQAGDRQIDELADKLKELARRQQQEAERQARRAKAGSSQQQQSGGGGQRQLAQEAEEAARRLEQLSREQNRPDLADAARQLQDAANAMRQAAANGTQDNGALANSALEKLKEAQQQLAREMSGRSRRDIQAALRKSQELAEEQKDVASEVNKLDQQSEADRGVKAQQLGQRKSAMDRKVGELQSELEKLANDARRDEKDAARKLDEASGSIRDKRVREKIRYSRSVLQGATPQSAPGMEEDISANLDALEKKIAEAQAAVGSQSKRDSLSAAADKTRELVRGMESLDQRIRDRANEQARNGQQQGQQGGGGDASRAPQDGAYGGARFTSDDVRQFTRHFQELDRDAQQLRQQLLASGINPADLDAAMRDLRQGQQQSVYNDPNALAKLQAAALERLKQFEFNLRKKLDHGGDSLALLGSDEVPAGFRQAIEEYYRSLARRQGTK